MRAAQPHSALDGKPQGTGAGAGEGEDSLDDSPLAAAIDLGTNNCRMLAARPDAAGFRVVDSFSRITRLGEGVAGSGQLNEAAMDRTLRALEACADRLDRLGVGTYRAVATAACRAAANRDVFLDRVKAATGLTLEVIPPEEEAQLALAGCAPLLEPNRPRALVFDIGGGSTELAWVALDQEGRAPEDAAALRPRLVAMESLSLGVVTMAEASGGGHLDDRLYDDVVAHVSARLAPFQARLQALGETPPLEQVQMLGTSGTVTTLGAIALGLNRYDRARVDGLTLDFPQIRAVSRQLLAMRPAERAGHPCIGRARADLVLAGCAILEAVCQLWPVGRLRVADRGIREGMLLALMQTSGPGDFSGATRDRDDGCSEVGCLE